METKQVTVQPAVGGMIKASKDSFVIPKEELKDFYLKFAFLLNPDSCSINRTEFELLNILLKDLKKILAKTDDPDKIATIKKEISEKETYYNILADRARTK